MAIHKRTGKACIYQSGRPKDIGSYSNVGFVGGVKQSETMKAEEFNALNLGNTFKLNDGEIIHNFTPLNSKWGWSGTYYKRSEKDTKEATMMGVGKRIEKGHYIAIEMSGNIYCSEVKSIEYSSNPRDLFTAVLYGFYEFDKEDIVGLNNKEND